MAMKLRAVKANNRRKAFDITVGARSLAYPYAKATPRPTAIDPVRRCAVDPEIACEGFTYALASGKTGTIHIEQVLDYNQDPAYLRNLLLARLTCEAQERVAASPLSKREIIRRLQTSATQFYRLLDPANTRTSIDQILRLLHVLECDVELRVRPRRGRVPRNAA